MRREKVEVRDIKDGARDRSPPSRRPGRVVGRGGRDGGESRAEGRGWGVGGGWGGRPNGLLRLPERRELNQRPGKRPIVPRCNGNWEILLREQSHGALIRDSIVAPAGHNHVWGWMETRYLLSRTPSGRIDSWQEPGPTLTSAPLSPIIVIAPPCSTPPPPPPLHLSPDSLSLLLFHRLPSLFSFFSSPSLHPSIPPSLSLFCLATSFLRSFICLPLSPSPAVGLCDGTLRRRGE